MKVGLILGLANEKNNQLIDINKKQSNEETVIVGDANMLMKM